MRWMVFVGLLVGCGSPEEQFRAEQAVAACEREQACGVDTTGQDCSAVTTPAASSIIDCSFDAAQADACVAAIATAECTATGFQSPPACGQVFVDCQQPPG